MVRYPLIFLLLAGTMAGQTRHVALTFDDLPRGGDSPDKQTVDSVRLMTRKLLTALKGVPVIGFVNASQERHLGPDGVQEILRAWVRDGAELGNHTWSHPDINRVSLDEYTADVVRGEPAITAAQGKAPRFFRHPFLHAGKDAATKQGLEDFLAGRGYRVAPVTIDNSDYLFAALYAHALKRDPAVAKRARDAYVPYLESVVAFFESRAVEVVGREIAQVLLLHANQLNADVMPELLAMFRRRGYRFVTLEEALRDPAYSLPDTYAGPGGFSWIHRWSITKKMKGRGEPEPEPWVEQEFQRLR